MNAAQQQYRSCFAAFVDDLRDLVDQAIRDAVSVELERLMASEKRKPPRAPRSSRRRAAAADNGASLGAAPKARRTRKPANGASALASDSAEQPIAAAPVPAAPPPLFVHKRSRDGQIQHLSRRDEGTVAHNSVAG